MKSTASHADRPDNIYGWGIPDVVAAIRWPEVTISVRDKQDQPLEGIEVELYMKVEGELDEVIHLEGVTDNSGKVSFPNLESGEWFYSIKVIENQKLVSGDLSGIFVCPDGGRTEIVLAN